MMCILKEFKVKQLEGYIFDLGKKIYEKYTGCTFSFE